MPAKLRTVFLGMTVGGATFLVAGFALDVTIAKVQYATLQARSTQAFIEANQSSTRAKDPAVVRYERVANAP